LPLCPPFFDKLRRRGNSMIILIKRLPERAASFIDHLTPATLPGLPPNPA